MKAERGAIRNTKFATQIRDFTGLCFGNGITPTDIDACLEFDDKMFVFIEAKHGNSECPYGQRLALERLCDTCWKAGKQSLLIFCRHDSDGVVVYHNLQVTAYRFKGETRKPYRPITVLETINEFRAEWDLGPHTQWPRPAKITPRGSNPL